MSHKVHVSNKGYRAFGAFIGLFAVGIVSFQVLFIVPLCEKIHAAQRTCEVGLLGGRSLSPPGWRHLGWWSCCRTGVDTEPFSHCLWSISLQLYDDFNYFHVCFIVLVFKLYELTMVGINPIDLFDIIRKLKTRRIRIKRRFGRSRALPCPIFFLWSGLELRHEA